MAKYYGAAADYNRPKGFRFDRRLVMIILLSLVALVFVSAGFLLLRSFASAPKNEVATLILREQRLRQFIASQQGSIQNKDLAKINSDANLLLTSSDVALRKQFKSEFGELEYTEDILRAEADNTSTKKLREASLINKFDATYLDILRDKIAATKTLAQSQTRKHEGALKTALQTLATNLGNIDGQLAQLNL